MHRDPAVISHDVDLAPINRARGKIPGGRIVDVRLVERLVIHEQPPGPEFHDIALQGDYPFEEHDALACQADGDHILFLRAVENKPQLITEIETSVAIGGCHAVSLDTEGCQDETEYDNGGSCDSQ